MYPDFDRPHETPAAWLARQVHDEGQEALTRFQELSDVAYDPHDEDQLKGLSRAALVAYGAARALDDMDRRLGDAAFHIGVEAQGDKQCSEK